MKKLFIIFLLFFAINIYGQDQDSVYISGTTSNAIRIERGFYLSEVYFGSSFTGTEAYLNAGDATDTTNFATTQSISGTRITLSSISAPVRVFLNPGIDGMWGQRSWKIVSNASESGQYIKYKIAEIK